jgi:beta-glucuronidase
MVVDGLMTITLHHPRRRGCDSPHADTTFQHGATFAAPVRLADTTSRATRRACEALLVVLVLAGAAAPASTPAAAAAADGVTKGATYRDGPAGRYLLGGTWLFRRSTPHVASATKGNWSKVTVPNAWNATDISAEGFRAGIGWYRKDFRLPSARRGLAWVLRFESVNYKATVWLNGTKLGNHSGAYLPFELRARQLKREGVNHLVVKVDARRARTHIPPISGAGWWNSAGLLREVYLRKVDRIDFQRVRIRTQLDCATCEAEVRERVTLRNLGSTTASVHLTGRFGSRKLTLGRKRIRPGRTAIFIRSLTLEHPRLWSPGAPHLYDASLKARIAGRARARYTLHSGVRSLKVVDGRLLLNGRPLNFRGIGLQEYAYGKGFAIDSGVIDQQLAAAKALGATLIRAHYPLAPYTHEQADRLGILIWSEIPVYIVRTAELADNAVRKHALSLVAQNIAVNGNHPSVVAWSIGNELNAHVFAGVARYIHAAARTARRLDPTRPVALAVAADPTVGCKTAYADLDLLGFNEYFGWYPGPENSTVDFNRLSPYLDRMRVCYPRKAIVISEFGAEANRDGPATEPGTYAFQQGFIERHLDVLETKPWLSGISYWALNTFPVHPTWTGGNPHPNTPYHEKALLALDGARKPAWDTLQRRYRATVQIGPPT